MAKKVEVQVTSNVSSFLSGMGKAVAVLAAFNIAIVKSTKAFAEFETGLANVSTLVDTSVVDMQKMQQGVLDLSSEVNKLPTDLIEGMYQVISAGAKPGREAFQILEQSAKLATAGLTDTKTAVDILTTTINAYGLTADDATRISDVLFKTVEKGKTTVGELASQLGVAVPIAATLGIKLEEISAATATLTKGGLSTDIAVTALKNAMFSFVKGAKEFEKAGIDITKVLSEEGLLGGLTALKDLTDGNIEKVREFIPDMRALQAILALTGKQFDEYNSILKANENATGATQIAFEKQTKTLTANLKKLTIEFQKVGISIGSKLAPTFNVLLDAATMSVRDIRNAFSVLPGFFEDISSFIKIQWNNALVDPQFLDKALSNWNVFAITLGTRMKAMFDALFELVKQSATFLFAPLFEASIFIWEKISKGAIALWQGIKNTFINGVIKINEIVKSIPGIGNLVSDEGINDLKAKLHKGVLSFQELSEEAAKVKFQTETLEGTMLIAATNMHLALEKAGEAAVALGQSFEFEAVVAAIGNFLKLTEANEKLRNKMKQLEGGIKDLGNTVKATTEFNKDEFEKWFGKLDEDFTAFQRLTQATFSTMREGFANAISDSVDTAETWADRMDRIFKDVQKAMIKSIVTDGINAVAKALFKLGGKAIGGAVTGGGFLSGITSFFGGGGSGGTGAGAFAGGAGGPIQSLVGRAVVPQPQNGGSTVIVNKLSLFENANPIDILMNLPTQTALELVERKILPALNKLGNDGASTTLRQKRNR